MRIKPKNRQNTTEYLPYTLMDYTESKENKGNKNLYYTVTVRCVEYTRNMNLWPLKYSSRDGTVRLWSVRRKKQGDQRAGRGSR